MQFSIKPKDNNNDAWNGDNCAMQFKDGGMVCTLKQIGMMAPELQGMTSKRVCSTACWYNTELNGTVCMFQGNIK
jgi:hypothetical protein